jgi:hypothetical protein
MSRQFAVLALLILILVLLIGHLEPLGVMHHKVSFASELK